MQKNKVYPKEFLDIIDPIISNEEFLKRKDYMHHGKKSVYQHSLEVSYIAYKLSKKVKVNVENATIAAILHDFYYEPWQTKPKTKFFKQHGFVHGREAADNSYKYFNEFMNKKIENSIVNHMFPLTIKPPRYKEGWIVTLSDKIDSLEVIYKPQILISFFIRKKNV